MTDECLCIIIFHVARLQFARFESKKNYKGLISFFDMNLFHAKSVITSELCEFAYKPVVFITAYIAYRQRLYQVHFTSRKSCTFYVYVMYLVCIVLHITWLNTSERVNKIRKQHLRYSRNISRHKRNDKGKQFTQNTKLIWFCTQLQYTSISLLHYYVYIRTCYLI